MPAILGKRSQAHLLRSHCLLELPVKVPAHPKWNQSVTQAGLRIHHQDASEEYQPALNPVRSSKIIVDHEQ